MFTKLHKSGYFEKNKHLLFSYFQNIFAHRCYLSENIPRNKQTSSTPYNYKTSTYTQVHTPLKVFTTSSENFPSHLNKSTHSFARVLIPLRLCGEQLGRRNIPENSRACARTGHLFGRTFLKFRGARVRAIMPARHATYVRRRGGEKRVESLIDCLMSWARQLFFQNESIRAHILNEFSRSYFGRVILVDSLSED